MRVGALHPPVEGVVQEQVGQQRADDTALRRASLPLLQAPIRQLHLGPQPPLDVEQDPVVLGVVAHRSHHEVPIDVVEETFDVEVDDCSSTPAPPWLALTLL